MQLSFTDRTYLVTGGGSGIGKGVAAGLVESGAQVMIIGRTADRLAAAADEIFSVLMGDDVESRKKFIQTNAKDVRFLDI